MKPRTTAGSGGYGGYNGSSGGQTPIRRTRSSPTKGTTTPYDTRMSLTSSIPTSSTRKSRKSYTQTLVEQRKKSKLKQQQQRQRQLKKKKQRLVRSSSDTSRKYKRGVLRSSTPIALKRNKRSFFGKSNNNSNTNNNNDSNNNAAAAADDRTDIGTTRTNQETTRDDDDNDDDNNNNDPPKEVTIKPSQQRDDEPEKDLIDTVGDAVVQANDAIVAMVCDNKMITKTIFPYVDGEYYDPNAVVSGEKREGGEEMEKVNDFYGGYACGPTNCTLEEEEGFEATPTAFYGVGANNNDEVEPDSGAGAATTGGGGSVSFGKLGGMVLGTSWAWRAPRQKKVKKSGKSTLDVVPEEAEDESSSVGKESGSEGKEAKVLLSMYDPPSDESDNKHNSNKKVQEEGTIVDGQDLELEMMNDRNVLALGVGAFAVCGGDENTIMTSDQREMTLQDAVVLEGDSDDIMETRKDKLLQQKRGLLSRMRARNMRAAKKSLKEESTEVESKNDASEQKTLVSAQAQAVLAAFNAPTAGNSVKEAANGSSSKNEAETKSKNGTTSSEQQEVVNAQAVLAAFNTDALILKSFEVDDGISMQSSISMASDLKSDSSSPSKDAEDKSTGTEEGKKPESDDSYPMLWWKWLTS